MKTFNLLALVLFLAQGSLQAGGIVPLSRWKTQPILIDGNDSDWEKPINFYDDKHDLFFAIRNDSTTLYLNFTVIDPQKVQAITRGGWTLELSAKNKKTRTKASLSFLPQHSGAMHNSIGMDQKLNFAPQGNPQLKGRPVLSGSEKTAQPDSALSASLAVMDYARNLHSFIARGFIFTHDEVPTQNIRGIAVCAGRSDPAGLLYEIAIPLSELFEEGSLRLDEQIGMSISMNASGPMPGQSEGRSPSAAWNSAPGGGGGRPGGGMGGAPGVERQGNAVSSSEKEIFRQKFRLTSH